jgi:hypothetical protein
MNRMTVFCVIALGGLGACDAYSPDLGETPFQCAMAAPRCPDDYAAVPTFNFQGMEISCVCTRADIAVDGGMQPDAEAFVCGETEMTNDSFEDASAIASPPIPLNQKSICPAGDRDFYKIQVMDTPKTISATVVPEQADVDVRLTLYNTTMTPVANSPEGTGMKQVLTSANEVGLYYVEVWTESALVELNYDMTFMVGSSP